MYIGTLDPNPHITGRGEVFLLSHMEVERFPYHLQKELFQISRGFYEQHSHEHIPAVSLLTDEDTPGANRLILEGQREGILQQSMELISGSRGELWIMSGRLSWLRELQLVLADSALSGRPIRILCSVDKGNRGDFDKARQIATAIGCNVAVSSRTFATRITLVDPTSAKRVMISIEKDPALHATILKSPHDSGLLEANVRLIELLWDSAREVTSAEQPQWVSIDPGRVIQALAAHVPFYSGARIEFTRVSLDVTRPLPNSLERFKLARLHLLEVLRRKHRLDPCCALKGSPWPVVPPVLEMQRDQTAVVIDGAHRVYSALERGEDSIEAILVRDVGAPLPAQPYKNWDHIVVGTPKVARDTRYRGHNQRLFRPIRKALESM